MFLATVDTIACTVEWAMAELLQHPRTMAKLQEELGTVLNSSKTHSGTRRRGSSPLPPGGCQGDAPPTPRGAAGAQRGAPFWSTFGPCTVIPARGRSLRGSCRRGSCHGSRRPASWGPRSSTSSRSAPGGRSPPGWCTPCSARYCTASSGRSRRRSARRVDWTCRIISG